VALSEYQRGICQLIAANRRANGESYVAGGVALNTLLNTPRLSRDIDLFHDTDTALITSWLADRQLLQTAGYAVMVLRETAAFVEAVVSRHDESVLMQWARDSAFRFFPLVMACHFAGSGGDLRSSAACRSRYMRDHDGR